MKLLAGLWSFEGLSEAGKKPSIIAHLAVVWRPQFLTIGFFIRALGVFSRHRSWLSPEGVTQKRASRKLAMPFMS